MQLLGFHINFFFSKNLKQTTDIIQNEAEANFSGGQNYTFSLQASVFGTGNLIAPGDANNSPFASGPVYKLP
jgi:hypothetical protein